MASDAALVGAFQRVFLHGGQDQAPPARALLNQLLFPGSFVPSSPYGPPPVGLPSAPRATDLIPPRREAMPATLRATDFTHSRRREAMPATLRATDLIPPRREAIGSTPRTTDSIPPRREAMASTPNPASRGARPDHAPKGPAPPSTLAEEAAPTRRGVRSEEEDWRRHSIKPKEEPVVSARGSAVGNAAQLARAPPPTAANEAAVVEKRGGVGVGASPSPEEAAMARRAPLAAAAWTAAGTSRTNGERERQPAVPTHEQNTRVPLRKGDEVEVTGDGGETRGVVTALDGDGDVFVTLSDGSRSVFASTKLKRIGTAHTADSEARAEGMPKEALQEEGVNTDEVLLVMAPEASSPVLDGSSALRSTSVDPLSELIAERTLPFDSSCMQALRTWPTGVQSICSGLDADIDEEAIAAASALARTIK
ncbi:hypothetical protein AB1Y20_007980 [Prymnesium parvum]|uniref:KOW domain-containing protein n=1 Tax=Prymnesium parvum TaxID=97485 RepID=A0AB34IWG3_PRYPA